MTGQGAGVKVSDLHLMIEVQRVTTRDAVHIVVTRSADWYVAECLELSVVTQARSFDALLTNLREAVALHMEGEDPAWFGLSSAPRLFLSYEAPLAEA